MPSSRGSSQSRDLTHASHVSCIGRWALYHYCHLGSLYGYGLCPLYKRRQHLTQASPGLSTYWLLGFRQITLCISFFSSMQMKIILHTLKNCRMKHLQNGALRSVHSFFFSSPNLEHVITQNKRRGFETLFPGNSEEQTVIQVPASPALSLR